MSRAHEFVTEVIELYREQTCLWKTTDAGYLDKNLRSAALDKLVELFKTKDPSANRDVVQKKITSMRGSFRKEFNKVKASERSGASTEDIHVPKLWYYDLMLFLEDQEVPRQSQSVHSILDSIFDYEEDQINESFNDSQHSPIRSISESSSSTSGTSRSSTRNFKRPRSKADEVLDKIAKKMDTQVVKTRAQHDAFGEHVAEKLRNMSTETLPICQKLINDAIFLADMNSLNETSHIVTPSLSLGSTDEVQDTYIP